MIAGVSILRYSAIKTFGFHIFDLPTVMALQLIIIARVMSVYEEDKMKTEQWKSSNKAGKFGSMSNVAMPIHLPMPH